MKKKVGPTDTWAGMWKHKAKLWRRRCLLAYAKMDEMRTAARKREEGKP